VVPEDGTLHPEYRSSLAVSYVFEFLYPFTEAHFAISGGLLQNSTDNETDTGCNLQDQVVGTPLRDCSLFEISVLSSCLKIEEICIFF